MRQFYLLLPVLFLKLLSINAQECQIRGIVIDTQHAPIAIFDVMTLSADSSVLACGTFLDGSFELESPEQTKLIKITSLGYTPFFSSLSSVSETKIIDLDTIRLEEESIALDEVVISAQRPLVKLSGDTYVVNVSNTYLAKVGTFMDVARRVPGITVSAQGGLGVVGKPRVLINLNGRAIRSFSELETLQSSRIKSISVDRNPSTMYSSSYDAIINVVTTNVIQDYFNITVANQLYASRVLSNSSSIAFNGRNKSLFFSSDISFSTSGLHQYDSEEKHVWSNEEELKTARSSELIYRSKPWLLNQIIEYHFRPQTVLGIGYQLVVSNNNQNKMQDFSMRYGEHTTSMPVKTHSHLNRLEHNPTIYFTNQGESSFLGIYADYYSSSLRSKQSTIEGESRNVSQDFKDLYDVIGFKSDYSRALKLFSFSTGVKASYIQDVGTYLTDLGNLPVSKWKSYSLAAYFNLLKSIGRFSLMGGLRYERECTESTQASDAMHEIIDSHLFPYLAVSYSGNINGSLSYSRRIYRPTYNQLIAKSIYVDPLSYSIGNPLLKSNLVDIVSLSIQKRIFSGTISYEHSLNKKAQIATIEQLQGTSKVKFTYDNIPHVHSLSAYAVCNYGTARLRGTSTVMLSSSLTKYKGVTYSTFKNIGLYIKTTLERSLWEGASVMLSASFQNAQYQDFYYLKPSFNTSLYFTQDLLQGRLKINLIAEDVFKTSRANNWVQTMQQAEIKMNTDADSRFIGFSVRYTFGKLKMKALSESSIQEEVKRLQ